MQLEFTGPVWEWRGPAPFYFVTVPPEQCDVIRDAAALVSYGWGMIPVAASIGSTQWTTSLFAKDGAYVVPLKDLVRKAEGFGPGDAVSVQLTIAGIA